MNYAAFSPCNAYRYALGRTWGDPKSVNRLAVCMLNPSTADADKDDPTIRRCIAFAKREGCDGLDVVNAYGLRSTDPKALRTHRDPVGPENDGAIRRLADANGIMVLAWGAHISPGRAWTILDILEDACCMPMCLGVTAAGQPRHPLYLRADAPLVPWMAP